MAKTKHRVETPPQPTNIAGRDEMNLAELPIALVGDRVPKGQKTLYFEDKNGRLTITGSDAYGLPTATDTDVIVALIYLTKLRNDFRDVKVNFSRYELIKLLGWADEGRSYKRLDHAFNRWVGVSLYYDGCWWNNRLKCHTDAKMHIIDSVEIVDNDARRKAQINGQGGLPLSHFNWNRTFIESCQADNLRQLDLDTYFSLKSAIAKRLYRFLGKRFFAREEWILDLNEAAFNRVGLSRKYTDAYKLKEKLQPAIEELEAIGFLKPLSLDERYSRIDRGQWTIRFSRPSPALPVSPATPQAAEQAPPEPPPLVAALTQRGVTQAVAEELVQRYAAATIEAKVEVFDWLMQKEDKRVAQSPAGYLVRSIEKDYATPKGFITKAERERRAEANRQREQQEAQKHWQDAEARAYEQAVEQAIDAYWKNLTSEQLAAVDKTAEAQVDPEHVRETAQAGPVFLQLGRLVWRRDYLRKLLASRGELPPAPNARQNA